jgi:hypothetical protein
MSEDEVPRGLLRFERDERPFALIDGRIVERKEGRITVELFSGFKFEVQEAGIISIQEYEDPVSHQGMVKIVLGEDAPLSVVIEPKMFRLAKETNALPLGFESMLKSDLIPEGAKLTEGKVSPHATQCAYNTTTYSGVYGPYSPDDTTYDMGSYDD